MIVSVRSFESSFVFLFASINDTPVIKLDNFVAVVRKAKKKEIIRNICRRIDRKRNAYISNDDQSKMTCAHIEYMHPFYLNPRPLHILFSFLSLLLRFNSSISIKNR